MTDLIAITHFTGVRLPRGTRLSLSWAALLDFLVPPELPPFRGPGSPHEVPVTSPDFDPGHPGWCSAVFRGDHRKKENIEQITLLSAEHDAGTVTPEEASAVLSSLDLTHAIITTKSHTADAPRWRLLVPVSRPFTVEERAAVLYALPPLHLARAESTDPARFWYLPSEGAQLLRHDARPIDVDGALALAPHDAPEEPAPQPAPPAPPSNAPRYLAAAIGRARDALWTARKGERHSTAAKEAFSLGGLVGGGALAHHEAEQALLSAIPPSWDAATRADAERTIRGQLREGALRPRHVPDLAPRSQGSAMPAPAPASTPQPTNDQPPNARPHLRSVPDGADPVAETVLGVKSKLLTSNNGAPRKTPANATTIFALDPRWSGVIGYHALGDRVVKLKAAPWHADDAPTTNEPGAWTDADTTRAQAWLAREYHLDLGADTTAAAVWAASERNVVDPLRDYFDRIRGTWDGFSRVDVFLPGPLGAVDTPYTRAVGRRWLISAVARALRPGVKVDCVLVLEGPQGVRKSTALATLCPDPALFFDDDLQIGDKDAAQSLRGKWICELGELSALTRHEIGTLKAFVTRRVDTYRPSFGRTARDYPRRNVFAASTNESEYLKDPTGNRRWWPVRVAVTGPIDIDALADHRDQLWAEALHLFESGAPHYVDTPELAALCREEQQAREQGDPWEEHVSQYVNGLLEKAPEDAKHLETCQCVRCRGVTTSAILQHALGVERARQTRTEEMRVGVVLRALGWEKGARCRQDGALVRPYLPPRLERTGGTA